MQDHSQDYTLRTTHTFHEDPAALLVAVLAQYLGTGDSEGLPAAAIELDVDGG